MNRWKWSVLAFVLALSGFWFVVVKNPAPSIAAASVSTLSPMAMEISIDLPSAEGGNAH